MSGFELTLRAALDFELDLADVNPAALAGRTVDSVKRQRLSYGQRQIALGDLFDVALAGDDDRLALHASCTRLRRIGKASPSGHIHVDGHAGDELGIDLRGGRITVTGDSGDLTGSGMRDGVIEVLGNAGDFTGGAHPSAMAGMRGGVITVRGHCGSRAGERLRRGLILIHGKTGDFAGSNMIAGTIVALGAAGAGLGTGMRRGTIVVMKQPADWTSNFNDCGHYSLATMTLLARYVAVFDVRAGKRLGAIKTVQRFVGDRGADGQGEILLAASG